MADRKYDISKKMQYLSLAVVLLLQLFTCLYFGTKKQGFYEDEMATYALSSCPDALWRTDYEGTWKSGQDCADLFIINKNTRFSYEMVYENQAKDVHPPLYYFLIHSLESFFPGIFSKWIGLVPNIVFCLLTTFLIFYISNQITGHKVISVSTAFLWAFSIGSLNTAVFIRMYAMLTFLATALLALHIKLWKSLHNGKKLKYWIYILLLLCTTAGILTQYYFMIFCFFLCGSFVLYLLFCRRWRLLFHYIFIETVSIVVSITAFPPMIYQIIGDGYRGKEAFQNAASSDGTMESLQKVASIISNQNSSGGLKQLIIISILIVVLFAVNRYFLHLKINCDKCGRQLVLKFDVYLEKEFTWNFSFNELPYVIILVTAVGYYVLVAKIAPFQVDRYYMCIYPLVSLLMAKLMFMTLGVFKLSMQKKVLSFILIIAVINISGQITQNVNYLYEERIERNKLHEYKELPVIIINGTYSWYPTAWLYEYFEHPVVFRSKCNFNLEGLQNASNNCDLTDGFLLYACRTAMEEEELFSKIKEFIPIASYEKIVSNADPVYLCFLEVN